MKCIMITGHKGGIGKTLIACNIALTLSKRGKKTALIDADIASSNITEFLQVSEYMGFEREKMHPGKIDGLQAFSMSLLVGEKAVSMNASEYSELIRDAIELGEWGDTEYAIVDMPAGSADEFKRIISHFGDNFIGSIIIIQPAHEVDARRVITLHLDNDIPIIGLIENMTAFKSGVVTYAIYGESIIEKIAKEFGLTILGKIPLSMQVRKAVAEKKPLPEDLSEPITTAVDILLTLKPRKPGFLAQIKTKVKSVISNALIGVILAANQEVDIPGVQEKFGYPGGRVIRLNIMDNRMEKAVVQADFRIWDGKLVAIEEKYSDEEILKDGGCRIDLKPQAFAMAVLGNRKLSDGSIYDLETAWRMGDARVYGRGETIRGAYFVKEVWNEIRTNQKAFKKVAPLLEALL